ncbi:E3 ubiquitin-protein ligase TRIM39-like [Latimeria chalumnae]|uniref:E3 ubiquitin-protein ligase TRIM39-like n=1 Tax=Latimeria chalumnae TaxID=7897 RepID=UPI00313DB22D
MAALTEATGSDLCCSICLDFYKDPVILDCSHSSCRACISQMWEKGEGDLSCPQCRQGFSLHNLKSNRALANIVESFKEMDLKAEVSQQRRERDKPEESDEFCCEEHEEKLKLFCEEDQKAICVICGMSDSHKSHKLKPIKETFQIYKKILEESVRGLQSQLKEAYKCREDGKNKTKVLQEKANHLKMEIRDDFSKLHDFLYKEEKSLKETLEIKEMEILKQLEQYGVKAAQEISKLEQLISGIQKRLSSQRAEELLKDIKAALTRAEVKFEKPERVSADLCEKEFISLIKYRAWRKMSDIIDRPVLDSITIDPKTAHQFLVISDDRMSLQHRCKRRNASKTPERFMWAPAALGSVGFTSGRHYWEVEVGDKTEWKLGVVRESVDRKLILPTLTENGFYILYKEEENYIIFNPCTALPLLVKPSKIGVYLDYEGGQMSFYNADDMSHIHIYVDTFIEKMYPYFDTMYNQVPLQIIPPNS